MSDLAAAASLNLETAHPLLGCEHYLPALQCYFVNSGATP